MSDHIEAPIGPTASTIMPTNTGILQRACPCGQHSSNGGECELCRKKREGIIQRAAVTATPANGVPSIVQEVLSSLGQSLDAGTRAFMEPRFEYDFSQVREHAKTHAAELAPIVSANENPPDVELDDDEFAFEVKPCNCQDGEISTQPFEADDEPHSDSATIECDGGGGYRVSPGWSATATCGIGSCVLNHERSHIADWQARWPNGCKNADGSAKPAGTRVPTGGPGYDAFLRSSECRAYTGEVPCGEALLASASKECRPTVQRQLEVWRSRKASYCSGGHPILGAFLGGLVGAGTGAAIGSLFGPIGIIAGGLIGGLVGALSGALIGRAGEKTP